MTVSFNQFDPSSSLWSQVFGFNANWSIPVSDLQAPQIPGQGNFGFDLQDDFSSGSGGTFIPQDPNALNAPNAFAGDPALSESVRRMVQQLMQSEMRGLPNQDIGGPSGADAGLNANGGLDQGLLELLVMLANYLESQQGGPRNLGSMGSGGGWGGGGQTSWNGTAGGSAPGGPSLGNVGPSIGGNSNAFNIAQSVLGHNIADLKYSGPLANVLDKWPGNNVCCANFVSACLQQAGQISAGEHSDSVSGLANNLSHDPKWGQVSLQNAKPGDVVCLNVPGEGAYGHVVMFAGWQNGKPVFIGSNNDNADGSQRISQEAMNYGVTAVFHYQG